MSVFQMIYIKCWQQDYITDWIWTDVIQKSVSSKINIPQSWYCIAHNLFTIHIRYYITNISSIMTTQELNSMCNCQLFQTTHDQKSSEWSQSMQPISQGKIISNLYTWLWNHPNQTSMIIMHHDSSRAAFRTQNTRWLRTRFYSSFKRKW